MFSRCRRTTRCRCGLWSMALSAILLGPSACRSTGAYTWAHEMTASDATCPTGDEYMLRPGDVVNIRVYEQENLSVRAKARTDGKLAVPLLGDVDVRGRRPSQPGQ